MARIRTIKPEFWKNEALSELPEATHMLAAALLNYADDEGYFNANPRLVQAECFPLRELSVSVPTSLISLSRVGFIDLGKGDDGREYGRIVSFTSHQVINRPTKSKIKDLSIAWGVSLNTHGVIRDHSLPEGNREQGTGNGDQGKDLLSFCNDDFSETQIAFDAYNDSATRAGWPKAQALTKTRKAALKARLKEAGGLDGWRVALGKAEASPHLCGQNDRGWTADLDFILQAKSFTKLMEGSYDRKQPAAGPRRNDRAQFDRSIAAVADGLATGSITLDTSSRDPFARIAGRDAEAD